MASIIFGEQGAQTIQALSFELQQRTLSRANELDQSCYEFYTPWLCLRPAIEGSLAGHAICHARYQPGHIAIDENYLEGITVLLDEHRSLTRDQLIGSYEDWQILENVDERSEVVPMLKDARACIQENSEFLSLVYTDLVQILVPLKQPRPRGWTCHYARGAVFLGFAPQYSIFDLALDLVHEMGHQALALFQSADRLIASNLDAPIYSEVRRTFRPAIQSLQATAAIAYMTHLAEAAGLSRYVHPEFTVSLPESLQLAIGHLKKGCEFTAVGQEIMNDFEELAVRCLSTQAPMPVSRQAVCEWRDDTPRMSA